jgi:hypothetical protein
MAGKHRATKSERRQTEAYVWLGTGAITLGLGVAIAGGSGVAQAEPTNSEVSGSGVAPSQGNSAGTTTIRTTVSAQSVNTSSPSSTPAAVEDENAGEEQATSVVTTKDSIVRQQDPAETGDNDAGPPSRKRCSDLITMIRRSPPEFRDSTLLRTFRSSSSAAGVAACSRGSQASSNAGCSTASSVEPMTGIEPAYSAWEDSVRLRQSQRVCGVCRLAKIQPCESVAVR